MLPPAPPRFSTKTEPPISCCIHPAIMRAEISEGPPGVLATTILSGRSGYAAQAELMRRNVGAARPAAIAPVALRTRRRVIAVLSLNRGMASSPMVARTDHARKLAGRQPHDGPAKASLAPRWTVA